MAHSSAHRSWCAAFLFAGAAALAMPLAASQPREVLPLRVGVIPFDDPTQSPPLNSQDKYLNAYFANLEQRTKGEEEPFGIRVVPVRGSYYQILQWLREGQIDGAVVSPFSAYLLTTDDALTTFPAVEFQRRHKTQPKWDEVPSFVHAEQNGRSLDQPSHRLQLCFERMVLTLSEPSPRQECELVLVNHLSTTGFLYPLLYAAEFVRGDQLTRGEQEVFWNRFMKWSRFTMLHNAAGKMAEGVTRFSFSYAPRDQNDEALELANGVPNLNDVLLFAAKRKVQNADSTSDVICRLLQVSPAVWTDAARGIEPDDGGYVAVAQWNEKDRAALATAVDETLRPPKDVPPARLPPIQKLYSEWYEHGAYTFTVDELVYLLSTDQILRRNRCAAVVLPGGGVRATYQAVMLDYLYGRKLENTLPTSIGDCAKVPVSHGGQHRLQVAAVAGTSGGALLGALVTHRTTDKGWPLTGVWTDDGVVQTTPSKIFPPFGVSRWLSILFALIIFAGTAAVHLQAEQNRPRQVPGWYTALLSFVIAVAPFVIWHNALDNPTYFPRWQGLAFLAVVLLAHFFHSVSLPGGAVVGRQLMIGALIILAGVSDAAVLIGLVVKEPDRGHFIEIAKTLRVLGASEVWGPLAALPIVLIILGIVVVAASQGVLPDSARMYDYGLSMLTVLALLALALGFFAIGCYAGVVSSLEMTAEYWVWAFCSALFASKVAIEAARLRPKGKLLHGLRFLVTPSGNAPFPYTPTVTLILWGVLSIGAYLVFIAPAFYSGSVGRQTFDNVLATRAVDSTPGMRTKEIVPLIVSMTAFGGKVRGQRSEPGDYYAYRAGWQQHVNGSSDTRMLALADGQFPEAVFASGSPFPIYPGALVPIGSKSCLFVDGGFAHRVPIEAALATGASQILIVENIAYQDSALADAEGRTGPLMQNAARALNYLFDRSQATDLQRAKSVLVGAIYPDWKTDNPFLMDFRKDVIDSLQNEALRDIERDRVGRVLSWGVPEVRP